MAFIYDPDVAYTCGFGATDDDSVSVSIGYELDAETGDASFAFEFVDGALTVRCSRALAVEIASAFASVAEG
jgi:hypothetical protein